MKGKIFAGWMAQIAGWTAFAAVVGYSIYSVETGTGPGGWLVDRQLQWFGSYGTKSTVLVPILLMFLVAGGVFAVLAKLFELVAGQPAQPANPVPAQATPLPAPPGEHPAAVLRLGLAILFGSLIIGGGGYLYLSWKHGGEEGSEFERIRLETGAASSSVRWAPSSASSSHWPAWCFTLSTWYRGVGPQVSDEMASAVLLWRCGGAACPGRCRGNDGLAVVPIAELTVAVGGGAWLG